MHLCGFAAAHQVVVVIIIADIEPGGNEGVG